MFSHPATHPTARLQRAARSIAKPLATLFAAASLLVCGTPLHAQDHAGHAMPDMAPKAAIAVLVSSPGNDVKGWVKFEVVPDGVHVTAEVSGLAPGDHGFHVHQLGDLSKPDLTSTGGHFNPEHEEHGGPHAAMRHVGDLGNLTAGADGVAKADFVDHEIALVGPHSIIGRAVIIHAGTDDLKSQPTGNAGGRVAGGVIGIAATP